MNNSINILINGVTTPVSVIRYFLFNEQRYLIYTIGEKDESGYVKLYVSKMSYEPIKAITITDDDEWNKIKDLIKITIKENRENETLSIVDLNYSDIQNIEVVDSKVFKLLDSMVTILASNKKLFKDPNDIVLEKNIFNDAFLDDEPEVSTVKNNVSNELVSDDYKELYLKEIENRKAVEKELERAKEVISIFKEKINDINDLLR